MEDITVTISYVTKLFCNLKSHKKKKKKKKKTCPKGVPSWLIQEIARVAPAVILIMQALLDLGRIPFSWKRHWSSRYFRKGNRSADSSNCPPSPPSSVRCVNTTSTVLTLVISLNMTPRAWHPHRLTTWLLQKILWHPIHTYNPRPSER